MGPFTSTATAFPAQVTVSAPGYISRQAWVTNANPRVDLFPERDFDLNFYRQLTRNGLDRGTGPLQPLFVLTQAPAFYMEVEGAKGFSVQVARTLEQLARRLVPELTGGRFQVTRWETGPTARARQAGWIVIERRDEQDVCGRALVGAVDGQILLDGDLQCFRIESTFAHELGHALGFFHVDRPGSMMYPYGERPDQSSTDALTSQERHHARLAYLRPRGNMDIDVDRQPAASVSFDFQSQMVE